MLNGERPLGLATENYNKSDSMMKNKDEQSLPKQAKTLFVPIGMAEDLAKNSIDPV